MCHFMSTDNMFNVYNKRSVSLCIPPEKVKVNDSGIYQIYDVDIAVSYDNQNWKKYFFL